MAALKLTLLISLCLSAAMVEGKLKGKLRYHHDDNHDKSAELSSETILFRDKLNQILDAESKEVNLLKNLLDEEHEAEEDEVEIVSTTPKSTEIKVDVKGESGSSLVYLREHGIVTKLEENSKRMEKMVVFLVDLRNLLTEALTQQNRQMAVESEMVEMREEMEYLRKELHSLKQDHKKLPLPNSIDGSNPSLENKLHNDHTTLEWLKSSTHELRTQITELSDQCNATLLMSLKQKLEGEETRRDENLRQAEKQIEILRLGQMRQQEEIREAKENVQDLRSWQVKMGDKMVESISSSAETNSVEEAEEERNFITEALKDAVGKPAMRHQQSHKRLKSKVHQLQQLIEDLQSGNKNHERRLAKLENSQRTLKSLISSTSSYSSRGRVQRSLEGHASSTSQKSIQSLERTLNEYLLTLERLNDKVSGMDDLQESTTQIFQTLEHLEKKYDDRVGEIQTGLARLESGVSGVKVTNEDLKEQQIQQQSVIQSVKKDLFQVKGKLQTNHLRLAAVQSQMLKWASSKCSDENSESIQNIRLATLEHALLDDKQDSER